MLNKALDAMANFFALILAHFPALLPMRKLDEISAVIAISRIYKNFFILEDWFISGFGDTHLHRKYAKKRIKKTIGWVLVMENARFALP